jgi:hypothetical protein
MQPRLGIGIITFNRKDLLAQTVEKIRRKTRHEPVDWVVADDGSTDGTLEMLRREGIPVVTGVNMGIAWNKNRALFLLAQWLACDAVVLLEDDTQPDRNGWEGEWVEAARRWGHVNYAGAWLREHFRAGAGTAADPAMSPVVTAQCSAYSRECLAFAGYFDPRFRGCGHEHVEHSRRLVRVGYGGTDEIVNGQEQVLFRLIRGHLTPQAAKSFGTPEEIESNLRIATEAMKDRNYRAPWSNEVEMRQFRSELLSAVASRPQGFALRGPAAPAPPQRSFSAALRRLLGR